MTPSKRDNLNKPERVEFVTFRPPNPVSTMSLRQNKPSDFNGWVRVKRYRVTIEEIPETVEVLAGRVQDLWDNCDNPHRWATLQGAAKRLGVALNGKAGKAR